MEMVKPKPDISLAKKTGHFNLLTTVSKLGRDCDQVSCFFRHDDNLFKTTDCCETNKYSISNNLQA